MSNRLEEYFSGQDICPSQLAYFISIETLNPKYKDEYLNSSENKDVCIGDLEIVDRYIDRKDSYTCYYILKFEGKFYKLTLHFESYGATWDTENVSWKNYTEVVPVTKTVVDYEVE